MSPSADDIAVYSHVLAAAVHLLLVAYLLTARRLRTQKAGRPQRLLVAALVATGVWAALVAAAEATSSAPWRNAASVADLGRYAFWFALLLQLLQTLDRNAHPTAADLPPPPLGPEATAGGAAAVAAPQGGGGAGRSLPNRPRWPVRVWSIGVAVIVLVAAAALWHSGRGAEPGMASRLALLTALALPLAGLLAVEQLLRNVGDDGRWAAKPLCLGLACVFVFDLYLYSEGLLFGRIDSDALHLRGAVHALAVPLLFVAARRRTDWMQRLQVSRTAAFYSATLVLAGGYLLFMSAIGYYVRYFGGSWGRALQMGLLAAALACGIALLLSGSLRAWVRVFVVKHFYSYRYDYREEWLRFTATLSSRGSAQETGTLIVRGLARMVECPGGSLWTRAAPDLPYTEAACWNMVRSNGAEPADSRFCALLRDRGWVIDLDEHRDAPQRYDGLQMPSWLAASGAPWLVVPLLTDDDLLGFVVLARARTVVELNWEVLDLLKTAALQAAGYLAKIHATEALLESRKFDAFNRMSAFVVHDLKNIVMQLSLMMKNAERLRDNPEFRQDMLLTVESSLEKMRRLMLQLREGATPAGGVHGVELAPLAARLQALAESQGRRLETPLVERLATRGHEDRLERVLGHLVQNALDATPPDGRVWLTVERHSGQVKVEVGDTGAGMTEDFMKARLFRPFNTTKHSGMGIGSYESHQYVRELGGEIRAASRVGEGTLMTVLLPLFDAAPTADALRGSLP